MLAPDSVSFRVARFALLVVGLAALSACATKQEVALVNDPSVQGRESALPWNQQQKWEGQGQFGGVAERMGAGGSR